MDGESENARLNVSQPLFVRVPAGLPPLGLKAEAEADFGGGDREESDRLNDSQPLCSDAGDFVSDAEGEPAILLQ